MPTTAEVIAEFGDNPTDSGKTEVQIALLDARIKHLTAHLKAHKHDYHTQRGLMQILGKQARLKAYLRNTDIDRYRALVARLGHRK